LIQAAVAAKEAEEKTASKEAGEDTIVEVEAPSAEGTEDIDDI